MTSPRKSIALKALEAAVDAGDEVVAAACRRVIRADRLGWRKHGDAEDMKLVLEFCA